MLNSVVRYELSSCFVAKYQSIVPVSVIQITYQLLLSRYCDMGDVEGAR